jgi:hypothetical protein
MKADCLSYLYNEKNKRNAGLNTQMTSLYVSKILYNIILSVKNNYKLKMKRMYYGYRSDGTDIIFNWNRQGRPYRTIF